MSNLGILLRSNVKCMFGALQGKKSRKKFGVVIVLCILGYLAISAVFGLQIFELFRTMGKIGLGQIPLFNSYQIVVMLLIILVFQSISEKSKTNDSDLLLSMPIKKIDIVLSKTLSKYLFSLILCSMIIFPTIILYCVYVEVSIGVILWSLLLLLLLPLMGVGINYIINFLITRFFNKMKYATLFKALFVVILFGAYMAIYIYASTIMGLQDITTIDDFLNTNFLVGMCVRIVHDNNLLNLLYLCLIVFGVFALGLWGYAVTFGKSYLSYKDKNAKIKFGSPSLFDGLLKKEIKKYFTTPILIINTLIGPLVLVAITMFVVIKGKDGLFSLFIDANEGDIANIFALITCVYLLMCASTLISCCTISMEGRYLWILRSTPVSAKKILISKSLINMVIFLPIHFITSITLLIVLHAGIAEWIMLITLPMLLNIIVSFGGTYINILLPKLEWESEVQVVKQSMSLVVTMIISWILALIPVVLNFAEVSVSLCGIITLIIYAVFTITVITLLLTNGVKKFEKLEC